MEFLREVAYQLQLPDELSIVHNVFYVSQLCKYIPDPSHVIKPEPLQLIEDLTYEKQPMKNLDHSEKQLNNKVVQLVKSSRQTILYLRLHGNRKKKCDPSTLIYS